MSIPADASLVVGVEFRCCIENIRQKRNHFQETDRSICMQVLVLTWITAPIQTMKTIGIITVCNIICRLG